VAAFWVTITGERMMEHTRKVISNIAVMLFLVSPKDCLSGKIPVNLLFYYGHQIRTQHP
jgi:hypothetical protein